jgi:glycosyltransferase involved in cell wall biosynthesis
MPLHGFGGLERSVHDLVRHLANRELNVTLIVPPPANGAAADDLASPYLQIKHVPYPTFPLAGRPGTTILDRSTAYLLYGHRAGRFARSLAKRQNADIIHGFGASLLGATSGARTAALVLNPQGLEEFGATGPGLPLLKRVGYAPLRWAVRRVARAADCIIATDRSLEPAVEQHLHPSPGQMRTIPNGVDLTAIDALSQPSSEPVMRQRHGIGAGEVVLLSVGRLEFNKGFDLVPAALADAASAGGPLRAMGWRWVILGDGPYRREIEHQVTTHRLEPHVLFAGRVADRDLHGWYEAASLFLHPTRYEGSSLVTLEAMAHRLPVIATVAGGLPDKVRPGVNGWLVEPDDGTGLARAVATAVSAQADWREMGAHGRQIVEREFAWSVLVDRQIEVYEDLIKQRTLKN